MPLLKRHGQSTIEYVMMVSLITAGLVAVLAFLTYRAQGRLQAISEYVAEDEEEEGQE